MQQCILYVILLSQKHFMMLLPPQLSSQPNTMSLKQSNFIVNLCRQQQ
jgi:hypothetical protein